MLHTIKSYLPVFPGFYNTVLQADEERYVEDGYTYTDYEWDYEQYQIDVAITCTRVVSTWLKEMGIAIILKYYSIHSPREYNFRNDSVNVDYIISDYCLNKIKSLLATNETAFAEYLAENHKSRSGFTSFYSHNTQEWINADWVNDTVRLGSILEFLIGHLTDYDQMTLCYTCDDNVNLNGVRIENN